MYLFESEFSLDEIFSRCGTAGSYGNSIFSFFFLMKLHSVLEKAVATYSSTLAWRISGKEGPGSLQSMG